VQETAEEQEAAVIEAKFEADGGGNRVPAPQRAVPGQQHAAAVIAADSGAEPPRRTVDVTQIAAVERRNGTVQAPPSPIPKLHKASAVQRSVESAADRDAEHDGRTRHTAQRSRCFVPVTTRSTHHEAGPSAATP
jgi:hypothetical protein